MTTEGSPAVEIINVRSAMPRLTELQIHGGAETIGQTLTALGVPEEELPGWQIFTAPNESNQKTDHKTVVLSPSTISLEMRKQAGFGTDKIRRYCDAFKPIASQAILQELALGVAQTRATSSWYRKESGKLRGWPFWISYFSITAAVGESGVDPFLAIGSGWAGSMAVSAVVARVSSPKRAARKLLRKAEETNPHLDHNIQQVILPIYT